MLIQKGFKKIKKIIAISLVVSLVVFVTFYFCKDKANKVPTLFKIIQLTKSTEGGHIESMEWTRDRKQVLFVRSRKEGQETINSLWVIRRDGSNERKLIEMSATNWRGLINTAHWTPDNKKIAFLVEIDRTIETPEKIYSTHIIKTIDINTGKVEELVSEDYLGEFSWSPDGKKFVYWKGNEAWISSSDGKNRKKLVTTLRRRGEWVGEQAPTPGSEEENEIVGFEGASPFIWSPDSTKFLLGLRTFETSYIYQVDILKGTFEGIPDHPPKYPDIDRFSPQWSPNNKEIFFVTREEFYHEDPTKDTTIYAIWIFDVKTKSAKRLADNIDPDYPIFCSPDGKKISFWREESKKTEKIKASLPKIPKISEDSDPENIEFMKKVQQLKLSPDIEPPQLIKLSLPDIEIPLIERSLYIMDVRSRREQKLPIKEPVQIKSDLIWIYKDISYINEAGHICLIKLKEVK